MLEFAQPAVFAACLWAPKPAYTNCSFMLQSLWRWSCQSKLFHLWMRRCQSRWLFSYQLQRSLLLLKGTWEYAHMLSWSGLSSIFNFRPCWSHPECWLSIQPAQQCGSRFKSVNHQSPIGQSRLYLLSPLETTPPLTKSIRQFHCCFPNMKRRQGTQDVAFFPQPLPADMLLAVSKWSL